MGDQSLLSSRAIIGMYFDRLNASPGLNWVNGVSNLFGSDQSSETYPFLGHVPTLREWVGGRQAKTLRGDSVSIENLHYEATIEFMLKDMRRDKTGQIEARINEFADRGLTHWASLLSTLILNGDSQVCYDGQYFFDTDHSTGESGTQSNKISVDISALPAEVHGSTTQPSKEEAQQAIIEGITQILGFNDDQGEPMNEMASEFLVKCAPSLYPAVAAGIRDIFNGALGNNMDPNLLEGMTVRAAMNSRLSSWTDRFAVFRTDSPIKALIRQQETEMQLKVKDETSEFAFDNDAIQIGVDGWRNTGFGYWQRACQVILT